MSNKFCGVPCSPLNSWELQLCGPAMETDAEFPASNTHSRLFTPQLQSLQFYADFYNDHHACCWPRTLLDTHMGLAADAISTPNVTSTRKRERSDAMEPERAESGSDKGGRGTDERETGAVVEEAKRRSYVQHVIQVVEQLASVQRLKTPRGPHARRIVYRQAVPPVLRCSESNDGLVYVLQGRIQLLHTCQHSLPSKSSGEAGQRQHSASAQRSVCTHPCDVDGVARDVFPLFLVMAPSDECALFVDSEAGSACEATQWKSQPIVLSLESVRSGENPRTPTNESELSSQFSLPTPVSGITDEPISWCATYSVFTWIVNPLGNQYVSSLVRSVASDSRASRRRGKVTGTAKNNARKSALHSTAQEPGFLAPLLFSFDLFGTVYSSTAAKRHILTEVEKYEFYTPHVTQAIRFSLGKHHRKEAEVAGDAPALRDEVSEAQVRLAYARRPQQLMRLLDTTMKVPASCTDSSAAPAGSSFTSSDTRSLENGWRDTEVAGTLRNSNASLLAAASISENGDAMRATHPRDVQQQTEEVPCVQTVWLGTLRTTRPVARERCALARATTLAAVLPNVPPQDSNVERKMCNNTHVADSERWPLRLSNVDGSAPSAKIDLTPLSTLQDLANALRGVSH